MKTKRMHAIYDELMNLDKKSPADRARGAAMVMDFYGDKEMSETLKVLSGQLDFGDSSEAEDAINRTNEKLDTLIEERKKHHAARYITALTDEQALHLSSGEVTDYGYSDITSSFLKHGLFDPDIFGGNGRIPYFDDENNTYVPDGLGTGMGHIKLPCHVVFESSYRIIADLLGCSTENIKELAGCKSYAVTSPGKSGLKPGTLVMEMDMAELNKAGAVTMTGGDAVYELLKGLNYSDQPERLAFSVLPVTAPATRPLAYSRKEEKYYSDPLNEVYEKILGHAIKVNRLRELGAPSIIERNECRMLNDSVNELEQLLMSRRSSRRHIRCNAYSVYSYYQASIAGRHSHVDAVCIPAEKTGEIESLNIYPKTIRVQEEGCLKDVPLEDVVSVCYDAIHTFSEQNAIIIDDDTDPDNLPEDLQKQIDETDRIYNSMQDTLDSIFDGARDRREAFTVCRADNGMYVPCKA